MTIEPVYQCGAYQLGFLANLIVQKQHPPECKAARNQWETRQQVERIKFRVRSEV